MMNYKRKCVLCDTLEAYPWICKQCQEVLAQQWRNELG